MAPSKPDVSAKPFFKECSAFYNQKFEIVGENTRQILAIPTLPKDQYIDICSEKFTISQERLNRKEEKNDVPLLWTVDLINSTVKQGKKLRAKRLAIIAPNDSNPRRFCKADSVATSSDRNGFTIFFGMAVSKFTTNLDYIVYHERGHFDDKHDILYKLYPKRFPEFDRLENQETTPQGELQWKEEKLTLLWKALTDQMNSNQKEKFDRFLHKIESSFPPSTNPSYRLRAINHMIVFANELLRYGKEKSDPRLKNEIKVPGFGPALLQRKISPKNPEGWDKDVVLVIALLKEAKLWEEFKKDHLGGAEPYLRADEPDVIAFAQLGIEAAAKYFPSAKKRK